MKTQLIFTIVALFLACLLVKAALSQDRKWSYRADEEEKKHSAAENAYASYEHGKQAVLDSAAFVKDKFGEATEEAKKIGSHLKEDIKDKVQSVQGTIHRAQDIAHDKIETIESKLHGAAEAVKDKVQNVKEKVQEKVYEWKDTAMEAGESVQNKASEISGGVKETVANTVNTLKHGAAKVQETVAEKRDFVTGKFEDAKETLQNLPYNVKSEFTNIVNDAQRSTQDVDLTTLRDQLNTLSQDLPAYLQEKFNSLTEEQQKQYNKAVEQARLEVHKAREAFTNALNHFQNIRFSIHKYESYFQQFKEWLTGDAIKVTERDDIVIV